MDAGHSLHGQFWLAGQGSRQLEGTLHLAKEAAPTLRTVGALTSMMSTPVAKVGPDGSTFFESHFDPDNTLRTIHGETDDGKALTLLETQNQAYSGGVSPDEQGELRRASHVVLGAHLSGRDHRFTAARARLQTVHGAITAAHSPSWGSPVTLANGGVLSLDESPADTWLVLRELPEASIRAIDRTYLRPLTSLMSLANGEPVGVLGLEVSDEEGGPWFRVHSQSHLSSDAPWPSHALLQGTDIGSDVVAHWLDQVDVFGPLPPVVARGLPGAISLESRVLELTTLAEGLHRRLRPNSQRYTKQVGDAIRDAAVAAASAVEETSKSAVNGLLAHVHEPGYGQRLRELAEMAEDVARGVAGRPGRLGKWKNMAYDARNDYAHRANFGWLEDADIDRYLTTALSMQWLLRAVMLSQAGFPSGLLATRFAHHEQFGLFLEQAQGWQPDIYM